MKFTPYTQAQIELLREKSLNKENTLLYTDGDIAKMYKEAKYPHQQILILRDLNCCSVIDICEALIRKGIENEDIFNTHKKAIEAREMRKTKKTLL